MKSKYPFLVVQLCICFLIGCSEISRDGPKKFFSNNQTNIRSIYSLYEKLDSVTHFEIFTIEGDISAIQVFWDKDKSYKYYNNSLENADLINFLDSNGVDKKDFFSLITLMREIKCKYVSKAYLNGESIYYSILGFDNGISLKDLQYIFFSGDKAENYFKNATNVKQVEGKIYFRYAKAPGD